MDSVVIGFPLLILFVMTIGVAGAIFWIWMLIDCATNEPSQGNDKLVWILIILGLNWLGGLIYFCVRRPQRIRQSGR